MAIWFGFDGVCLFVNSVVFVVLYFVLLCSGYCLLCYTVVLFVLLLLDVCGRFGFCSGFDSLILWILGLLGWLHVFLLVFASLGCAGL